jgi:hypothetical protein
MTAAAEAMQSILTMLKSAQRSMLVATLEKLRDTTIVSRARAMATIERIDVFTAAVEDAIAAARNPFVKTEMLLAVLERMQEAGTNISKEQP